MPPEQAAEWLLAQVTSPKVERALFGLDPLLSPADQTAPVPEAMVQPMRNAVDGLLASLAKPESMPAPHAGPS